RWQVRLWVAYADLLERADRQEEAKRWITLAADVDTEGLTDAAERLGRPAVAPAEEPTWADDEQISVLDAYDPDADTDADADPDTAGTVSDDDEDEDEDEDASGSTDAPQPVLTPSPEHRGEEGA